MNLRRKLTLCSLILIVLGQVSCEESKSQKVSVAFVPKRPIVINANINIEDYSTADPSDYIEVAAPWFRSELRAVNGADTQVTIVGFNAIVKSSDGQTKEYTSVLDEDQFYITTLAPGETFDDPIGTYFDALPEVTSGPQNFRFRVTVTVIGWFGSPDDPQERFQRVVSFSTN